MQTSTKAIMDNILMQYCSISIAKVSLTIDKTLHEMVQQRSFEDLVIPCEQRVLTHWGQDNMAAI